MKRFMYLLMLVVYLAFMSISCNSVNKDHGKHSHGKHVHEHGNHDHEHDSCKKHTEQEEFVVGDSTAIKKEAEDHDHDHDH